MNEPPGDWREKWARSERYGFTLEELRAIHEDLRDDDPKRLRREVIHGLAVRERMHEELRARYAKSGGRR